MVSHTDVLQGEKQSNTSNCDLVTSITLLTFSEGFHGSISGLRYLYCGSLAGNDVAINAPLRVSGYACCCAMLGPNVLKQGLLLPGSSIDKVSQVCLN
jgi:hypothetical protein